MTLPFNIAAPPVSVGAEPLPFVVLPLSPSVPVAPSSLLLLSSPSSLLPLLLSSPLPPSVLSSPPSVLSSLPAPSVDPELSRKLVWMQPLWQVSNAMMSASVPSPWGHLAMQSVAALALRMD